MTSVLLIDDDADARHIYKKVLGHYGVDCRCEATWAGGRRALEEGLPEAILLDLALPETSGLEVLRVLKKDERYRTIPVIVITASDLRTLRRDLEDAGAHAVMGKPVATVDLVATIQSATKPS